MTRCMELEVAAANNDYIHNPAVSKYMISVGSSKEIVE